MNDRELDQLIAAANPFGDDSVRQLPTGAAGSELLEEILTTTEQAPALKHRRRLPLIAAAAATVAIAVGITGALFPRGNPAAPAPAFAAEAVAVAQANQRLLIDDPNWKVTSVGEFKPDRGGLTFTNGKLQFDLDWMPAKEYTYYVADHTNATYRRQPIELLGQRGGMYQSLGWTDFTTLLPPKGQSFLWLRANLGSEQAYRDLLAKIKQVDTNTWLSALPKDTVMPKETKQAVTEMLADMKLPAGFNKTPLYKDNLINRYDLGVRVAGAVSCAWLDRWYAARTAGKPDQMKEAVAALQGSHHWKILLEMKPQGDYPDEVWGFADSLAQGQVPSQDGYRSGLVCK